MPGFFVAAAHKSSGKTVISTGLAAALSDVGAAVQCFKKGPDYIDPMWLQAASGRSCYNLDFNTMSDTEIRDLVARKSTTADICLVEANKGLFDGVDVEGSDSNAQLAKTLGLPVILVIDTNGMTRGIAPLLLGYQAFDPKVEIAGVILNKVGGPRHEAKLRAAIERYTSIPVLGAVGRSAALGIDERHLGLSTPSETPELAEIIDAARSAVADAVDLDAVREIAGGWVAPEDSGKQPLQPMYKGLTIAVARDRAFGFYYSDDLDTFEARGARLEFFDACRDQRLPDCDGLLIGGGFPETQMQALSANTSLRADIADKIAAGLPAYAECGGLMYLCNSLFWKEETADMCGVIDAVAVMCERPQGRGYIRFRPNQNHPWDVPDNDVRAHEFHYARLENLAEPAVMSLDLSRGNGIGKSQDGLVKHNLLAGFAHQRHTQSNPWIEAFLGFVKEVKSGK